MLRKALLTSALAAPVLAASPFIPLALAQDQPPANASPTQGEGQRKATGGGDGMSYGEKARANQPQSVDEIDNLNSGARMVEQFQEQDVAGGDPTFALPVSALLDEDLRSGDEDDIGGITAVVMSDDGTLHAAVDMEDGGTVLVPFSALRVQTGRGPENWMLVTGITAEDMRKLPKYDESKAGLTSVSDAIIGMSVQRGDDEVGTVRDAVIHSQVGVQGLVVDAGDRRVMIPARQVSVSRAGGKGGGSGLRIETSLSREDLASLPEYVFGDAPAAITAPGSEAAGLAGEMVIGDNPTFNRTTDQPTASEMLPEDDSQARRERPFQAEDESDAAVPDVIRPSQGSDQVD